MKRLLYKVAALLLLPFPKAWNNKDTQGAVMCIIVVSLILCCLWLLTGCYGYQVTAEYEHHSSIPNTDDLNTTDQVGACVLYPLGEHRYATEMEVCMHKELDKPVFGDDPVGTVRIRQQIYRHD